MSSREISERFEKEHKNVLQAIDNLQKDLLNFKPIFFDSTTSDKYGRAQRAYLMNRDDFGLLVVFNKLKHTESHL